MMLKSRSPAHLSDGDDRAVQGADAPAHDGMDLGDEVAHRSNGIAGQMGIGPVGSASDHFDHEPVGGRQPFLLVNPHPADLQVRKEVGPEDRIHFGIFQHSLFRQDPTSSAPFFGGWKTHLIFPWT